MKDLIYMNDPTYDAVLTKLIKIDGLNPNESETGKQFDNIIVFAWAKYAPKLSKEMFETIREATAATNKKFLIISINCDLQEKWFAKS